MKRYLFLVVMPLLCLVNILQAQEGGTYPEMTPAEKEAFYKAMDQEIVNAKKRAQQVLEDFAAQKEAFDPTGTIRADAAAGSLTTKSILVRRFRDAPSIKSPKVREKLLSILKKDEVTMQDLQELDQLVLQERPKL